MIMIGLFLQWIDYYAISTLTIETSPWQYILSLVPIGLGMGIFISPNNSAIMGAASPQQLGIVSGLLSVSRTLGQSIGIAVIGAVWTSRVFDYVEEPHSGGVTIAPPDAQMHALQDAFFSLVVITTIALLFNLGSIILERRSRPISAVIE